MQVFEKIRVTSEKSALRSKKDQNKISCLNIKKIYIFQFLMGSYMISGIIIPFFLTWGKLNLIELSFLQSYYFILAFILEIPCGMIADRLKRKWILFLSGTVSAVGAFIYGIIPNLILFFVGESFFALGTALMSGSCESFIYDSLRKSGREKEFTRVLGKAESSFLIGFLVSSPIGSFVGYFISLPLVMILMGVPYFSASIVCLFFKETKNEPKSKKIKLLTPIKASLKNFKKNKILRALVKDMLLLEILVLVLFLNYQYYLHAVLKVPLLYFGFIDSSFVLLEVFFTYLLATHKNKFKNNKALFSLFSFIPGICYVFLGIVFFLPMNILLILIIVGLGLSRYVIFADGINKRVEKEHRATSLSLINMVRMFSKGIVLPLFALFILWDLNFTFVMIGVIIIIISVFSRKKIKYL
ncbi:MAG: MFS transporter [Candidatus Lokiarchaeota archaeon]|nr:MFS transporter [Candidatus Lokiarchaeota archaeon]